MTGIQKSAGMKMQEAIERIVKAHGCEDAFKESSFHLSIENEPWMRLVIECINGCVCVAHYYMQNGDAMRDPEIVFSLPSWEAVEITQDPMGQYHAKYKVIDGVRRMNVAFDRNVHPLVRVWARNLIVQGFHKPKDCVVSSLTHPKAVAA